MARSEKQDVSGGEGLSAASVETRDAFKAQLVDLLPSPVMAIGTDFRVTYMNSAGAGLIGLRPEDCVGRSCYDLFRTPHCRTAECRCDQAMRQNRATNGETVADPQGLNMPIFYSASPLYDEDGRVNGALEFVQDITETKKAMADASEKVEYLQNLPTPILAIDRNFTVRYMNLAGAGVLGLRQEDCLNRKCYDLFKTPHCRTPECRCEQAMSRDGVFTGETTTRPGGREIIIEYTGAPVKDAAGSIIGAVEFVIDATERKNVLNDIVAVAHGLASGDLTRRLEGAYQGDFALIADNLNKAMATLEQIMSEINGACRGLADGDLTVSVQGSFQGSFGAIVDDLNGAVKSLHDVVAQVAESVDQLNTAGGQISVSSQSVAEGTSEQASSLEEVSSSLEEMSSMTKQNAENARQAQSLTGESTAKTREGNDAMERMNKAILDIKKSSDETAKILKTIDEIAFQTNLLALNAAVEAARAGEAGKGFAVVAEEVRNLAMRSAEAAKTTADLIAESGQNSENGVKIAGEVSQALALIADGSVKVDNLVAEIAAASNEQAQGIEQINIAISQVDKVTQTNASNSEESASAAEELSSQAAQLADIVSRFTVSAVSRNTAVDLNDLLNNVDINLLKQLLMQAKGAPAAASHVRTRQAARKKIPAAHPQFAHVQSSREVIPLDDDDFNDF